MKVEYKQSENQLTIKLQGWTEIRQFLSLRSVIEDVRDSIRKLCQLPR